VTIVEIGSGPALGDGRRKGDRLIATAQTPADAELIVLALNSVDNPSTASSGG
jgi:hypothetical protein